MRSGFSNKHFPQTAVFAASMLLAAGVAPAANLQVQKTTAISLTAQRMSKTMPDGTTVPMWGYCPTGSCSAGWAPGPTLIVPTGNTLQITLKNALPTQTSLVILGQLGGELGSPVKEPSPAHAPQTTTTWPTMATATFTPPPQPPRVRSFAPEADADGGTHTYTWTAMKPGTYIYETGTQPSIQAPMGLYGIIVVTKPPVVGYASDATPFANSKFFPKNTQKMDVAPMPITQKSGFWGGVLTPKANINQAAPPALAILEAGVAFPNLSYDADVAMLFSEVDAVQNAAVDALAAPLCTAGACSGVIDESKYPAAVNYTPTYFLINGQAYDQTAPEKSAFPVINAASTGNVMLRYANAGSHTHIPAVAGLDMSLVAEDGNVAPGRPRVQSEVLLTAGKTYDTVVQPASDPAVTDYASATFPIYDRQLSLSTGNLPNGGMHGFLRVGNGAIPAAVIPTAVNDVFRAPYNAPFNGNVRTNDIAVISAVALTQPAHGTVVFNSDGTFGYTPHTGFVGADSFTYRGNPSAGSPMGTTNVATVTLSVAPVGVAPTAVADAYTSKVATLLKVSKPGVLGNDTDPTGYPIKAQPDPATPLPAWVTLNADGSFTATPAAPGVYTFNYVAVNSQGTASVATTVTLTFPAPSGIQLSVLDAQTKVAITDYRWTIEEDTTIQGVPGQTPLISASGVPATSLGTTFHSSFMPVVATGCTGPVSCGQGQSYNGVAVTTLQPVSTVDQVVLDPTKKYYVSILPGDGANAWTPTALTPAGHTMGGAPITQANIAALPASPGKNVTALLEPNPLKPAQLSIYIFEDNNPTNNDIDDGEVGLGDFSIIIVDVAGRSGDPIGQMTYDAFNMPLTNYLIGTPGCPDVHNNNSQAGIAGTSNTLVGVIYTCPSAPAIDPTLPAAQQTALAAQYAIDYALAGHALVKNLMPGRFDVIAHPGQAREAAGETWYQVSTLEGTPGQDAFAKVDEPSYFQEFGPPGFHTFIGFVNPNKVNKAGLALGGTNTITGRITNEHMSRPSQVTLYDSASRAALSYTQCYVALNSAGGLGATIQIAQCDPDGNFTFTNVPPDSYQVAVWDQWLDQIIDFQNVNVPLGSSNQTFAMGDIPELSWFTRVEASAYMDLNRNGIRDPGEPGVASIPFNIRFRDGSFSNITLTDSNGYGIFNEVFPLFNWYVMESDTTRFKPTGVNVTVDAGGAVDKSGKYAGVLNSTYATVPAVLPPCPASTLTLTAPCNPTANPNSTNRIDPPATLYEGLQGFISETAILDWGKIPYNPGENGGIQGTVVYYSTRPFDDVRFDIQNLWEPLVPRVTVNLYQEVTLPDGTQGLKFVESTQTSSWDDFVKAVDPVTGKQVNLQCPGNLPGPAAGALPPYDMKLVNPFTSYTLGANDQFRCFDGWMNWNQVQPAPYDGAYTFKTGPDGKPLAPGKYVVEVIPPPGYTITKEEDKNILIGDAWVAPVTQQFGGLSNIFILPDQATLGTNANPNNPGQVNPTMNLGVSPGGGKISFPPCVGDLHRVPDYLTLFPAAQQVAPFAGADKPLCDRKEVVLEDQQQSVANFFIYTEAHIASHFAGIILDDASSEFNAAAPDFGEKGTVPFVPVSIKDFNGVEISRLYSDQWGAYNGLTPSSWQVNVPNPAGYSPNMITDCINDPGPIPATNALGQMIDVNGNVVTNPALAKMVTDPQYNPGYSTFCYNVPFMPGMTDYLDTPLVPIAAFAAGYNPPDCAYPDYTPAIARVDSSAGFGPYLPAAGGTLTITALGDQQVPNPAYAGPFATIAPTNQKTILRHYAFASPTDLAGAVGTVTLGGVPLTVTSWSATSITVQVPGGTRTGELVITAPNGRSSIDAVTVTVEDFTGATSLRRVQANAGQTIQAAIDAATPGDLIMVDAGIYNELVIMWKPVRLQGVGAASVIIQAAKYPMNKLDAWRPRINASFGVDSLTGNVALSTQVDPLPNQIITGGVVLLEPSVLNTEEGAGITVLAKGLNALGLPLTNSAADCSYTSTTVAFDLVHGNNTVPQPGLSNFLCAPSRIDGLSVTGGDAGGGIYVNGWAHNVEISNNRVYGNAGAFNGGIRVGVPYIADAAPVGPAGTGFAYDVNVKVHNNSVTKNGVVEGPNGPGGGLIGDVGGGGAGGGVSMCTGSDGYSVDHNWVCGNYSSSDGAGIGHIGLSQNGTISHNIVMYNQSFQQTMTTSGGGIAVAGESPDLFVPGGTNNEGSLGTGNVLIDSNYIRGNMAESGEGGGIRLQQVNGADVAANPNNSALWYRVTVSNNTIVNNVAGWAGGGISLMDTVNSVIINNTIAQNDATGIAGVLLTTSSGSPTRGTPHPAGISTEQSSMLLLGTLGPVGATLTPAQQAIAFSNPLLNNNIIWQNRSFFFDTSTGSARLCSSNNVADAAGTLAPANCVTLPDQTATGQCIGTPAYWDLGMNNDTSVIPGAYQLNPTNSVLTSTTGYEGGGGMDGGGGGTVGAVVGAVGGAGGGAGNTSTPPAFVSAYCNGSRVSPEFPQVINPPSVLNMQTAATLDEGNNFVNMRYGPLYFANPLYLANPLLPNPLFGDYTLQGTATRPLLSF